MTKSETIVEISGALLKAQKNIKSVTKEASNPFFRSKYADLASVINACKEELNAEGITVLQPIDGMSVETILLHVSGEFMTSQTPIVCKSANNPQDLGSAITYARRYGLQSFIFLPAVDDDGERATDHNSTASNTPKTVVVPTPEYRQDISYPPTPSDPTCAIHNTKMIKWSHPEDTNLTYFAHVTQGKKCYGK